MIKALIVENESASAEFLMNALRQHCAQVNVLKIIGGVNEALLFLKENRIDLLFLDVELNGETGFDLLRRLHLVEFEIIFTTAHDKYALQAIKNSCLEYLMKPIDVKDLQLAISKFENKRERLSYRQLENLLFNLKQQPDEVKITISTTQGYIFIPVAELVVFEADSNYTNIYTLTGQKHVSSKNLGEYEAMLPESFFRCHKSFIINTTKVREYKRTEGNLAIMSNGQQIEIALRRKEEFLKRMKAV